MKSGIYQIVCRTTGERYIGSSTNIVNRWGTHRSSLRNGVHSSGPLQAAWDAYGEENFFFGVIVYLPKAELRDNEIAYLQAAEPAYNIRHVKGRVCKATGKSKSESHVMNMSRANIGRGRGYGKVKHASSWRAHIRVSPMQRKYVYFRTEAEAAAWVAAQRGI